MCDGRKTFVEYECCILYALDDGFFNVLITAIDNERFRRTRS